MKNILKLISMIILISLSLIILSSCGTKYICADGSEVKDASLCPYDTLSIVNERDATKYAEDYVKGHVRYLGLTSTTVNTYRDSGNYVVNFVIAEKSGKIYDTAIKVDRMTGTPSCVEGCDVFIPRITSFSAIYNSSFISEENSRYLNIIYVVEDSEIISCEGTYSFEVEGETQSEVCDVAKLIAEDYNLPVELITFYEQGNNLTKEWSEGNAAYSLEVLE